MIHRNQHLSPGNFQKSFARSNFIDSMSNKFDGLNKSVKTNQYSLESQLEFHLAFCLFVLFSVQLPIWLFIHLRTSTSSSSSSSLADL